MAYADGNLSTATGDGANASGFGSTATGNDAQATGDWSTATGNHAKATVGGSTATGYYAEATGKNSVALGAKSKASHDTNHRAAQAENNAVARSNNYTDNRFGELRQSLEHTEKRLNAGIAGVTALSSIPYAAVNKFSYGIGAGNYQNGNAVAAGVQFRVSQSTNVRLNISWDSAGNNATGVGIAGGW
ncbi:YadA-like family protein [Salmonella enterica]|uniref:YadA-like family protein n=1 Tax=Salmonella enterica TaxID=28901 RepID=UPI000D3A2347|nr:YadA-like family protein [Salmonella enterica]PUF68438.1 hypothetical protein DAX59_22975 [Salmonella enterica subsp. enterica]